MANWWSSLDPDTQQALILAGATAGQGYFDQRAEDARADASRQDSAITNQAEGIQAIDRAEANDFQFNANRQDSNTANAARMAGNSPLQFQGDRARMSALRDVLGGAGQTQFSGMPSRYAKHMPSGMSSTPFSAQTMGFMDGGSMAAAEAPYWQAQARVDPSAKSPDLGALGYGAAGDTVNAGLEDDRTKLLAKRDAENADYAQKAAARRAALMEALKQLGPDGQKKTSGSGNGWKTAAAAGAGLAAGYFL